MNFMFSWQKQYLTRSLPSLMRNCFCHSNIKFISSRHRAISSMSILLTQIDKENGQKMCMLDGCLQKRYQGLFGINH